MLWKWKPENTAVYANYGVNANRGVAYCDGKLFLLTLDMHVVSIDPSNGKTIKDVVISDTVPGRGPVQLLADDGADLLQQHPDHRRLRIGLRRSRLRDGVHDGPLGGMVEPVLDHPAGRRGLAGVSGCTSAVARTGTRARSTRRRGRCTSPPRTRRRSSTRVRPGPNPRTDSVIALDVYTGRQQWWQQQIPGDQWGYRTSQPVLLYTLKIGGKRAASCRSRRRKGRGGCTTRRRARRSSSTSSS